MEVKKTGIIEYKIFKERDLKKLIEFLMNLKEEINHERTELRLEIHFEDGTTNIGYDTSVLDDTKIIKSVVFSLTNYSLNKKIYIYIKYLSNDYSVAGEDQDWVNAKFTKIKEIIETTPKQNFLLSNHESQSLIGYLFGLTFAIFLFLSFFSNIIDEQNGDSIKIFISIAFSIMVGQIISKLLLNQWLFKLYPEIEFDTTLAHINKNQKKRSVTWTIAILVFLPLILNFISSHIF
ncbi:hypothetical protein [Planomicrobium sp. CPCC 101110]|uniref:hypothetical protein n=1 Tax=Planomicrobium sp. CPCC 101110 TaxID=2599619 RepID=UPI0011B42B97|nr:hypothetical protein [Planomicrobium sp. CPCC 101110]TWT26562.1 hypothetical protein FQV30_07825 [Planomicrobium sp. CPCC 101110]